VTLPANDSRGVTLGFRLGDYFRGLILGAYPGDYFQGIKLGFTPGRLSY